MAETVSTADASGQVKVQSPQDKPTPKAKQSNRTRPQQRSGGQGSVTPPPPETRGRAVTNWDNPEQDPNLRVHAGDDPTGEANAEFASGKKALKGQK